MIIAENLVHRYTRFNPENETKESVEAISGISVNIKKGEFTVILGHNGSGKSTFAKHLNVLLTPTEGKVFVAGLDTSEEKNTWPIRQKAGMVFQNPDNQIIATIVEEDVAFGPENLSVSPEEIRIRVNQALESVNMTEFSRSTPSLLSGGQKQRIAIAGVLAMNPELIVLDEATAMLDPVGRKEVMNVVKKLNKEKGITVLHITHYMEEAVLADRVIVVSEGKIAKDGTPKEVFKNTRQIKALGLDVPQITELATHLISGGLALANDIISIKEMTDALCKIERKVQDHKSESISRDMPFENTNYIEIKNLSHVYSPDTVFEKRALSNINLSINKGEFFGIIGHTGSGKSTLIQHLNALIKPTSGEILINGQNINADKSKLKSIRQKVGLIFQYPENQLFEVTVFDDVAFGPKNMGYPKEEVDRMVKNALNLVGLEQSVYNKSPFELSGGQKRRVAIAGVLAMEPEILVMDEPTAGLDPKGRDEIFTQIKKLHKELNNTVIIVSHSMEDIAKLCDRVAVISGGALKYTGTPKEVFRNAYELEKIGLGAPQITYLIKELNNKGFNLNGDIYTVKEAATAILEAFGKPLIGADYEH